MSQTRAERDMQSTTGASSNAALFISYDGLTDPLGGSQILPYVRSIAAHPRKMHVLSFEKPDRFAAAGAALAAELAKEGIGWTPLTFSHGGKLAKAWDLIRMYAVATKLVASEHFSIVHCRSYQAAQVGRLLKRLFGTKVLFDMRGLWVDERMDGGIWSRARRVDRLAYAYYKRVERVLLQSADHVVALTQQVVPELRRIAPRMQAAITVIPCCADFSHFDLSTPDDKRAVRQALGIPHDAVLLSYLGSLGTWYCLEEMLATFATATHCLPNVHMLLVTRDWKPEHDALLASFGAGLTQRLHVRAAARDEVPRLVGASDVMLSYIKPAYSKMASSPTKLAEAFACGVPAICNPGIGDVDGQLQSLAAGVLIELASAADPATVKQAIKQSLTLGGQGLRARAQDQLDLPRAIAAYREVYASLERT